MMKKAVLCTLLLICGVFYSCATFSKRGFKKEFNALPEENITQLNGIYSLYPIKSYMVKDNDPNKNNPNSLKKYGNAYIDLLNVNFKEKIALDSLLKAENKYTIKLQLKNKKELAVQLFENSLVIKDTLFVGRYKKGMFYLDNTFLKCRGVPYLLGGCEHNKRRIGLTKNGNLLINEAVDNSGAFLIIFAGGYNYNKTYEYKREETENL